MISLDKKLSTALAVGFLVLLAAVTNPGKETHHSAIISAVNERHPIMGPLFSIGEWATNVTTYKNYVLWSITIGPNTDGTHEVWTLGLFGQAFVLDSPESSPDNRDRK
jgi:hypothetical protein